MFFTECWGSCSLVRESLVQVTAYLHEKVVIFASAEVCWILGSGEQAVTVSARQLYIFREDPVPRAESPSLDEVPSEVLPSEEVVVVQLFSYLA